MSERHKGQDEQQVRILADSIMGLSCELQKIREQAHEEHQRNAILYRIERKIDQIMATQTETAAELRTANEQLKKLIVDTAGQQPLVDALKAKIVELEALVASGSATQQELADAVAETKTLAQAVDDNVPELPAT